jgi:nitrite reductase (NADH) small subunit
VAKRILVGEVAQLPMGEGRTYAVGGRHVALFHTRAGDIFATQAECPHRGGPLADGLVGGTHIICPLHDRVFDLRTGEGPEPECALEVFPVSLGANGEIWVDVFE